MKEKFWLNKTLDEFSQEEWERLCDFCGLCCLYKLHDESDNTLDYTNVACEKLDLNTGHCSIYNERQGFRSDCLKVTPIEVMIPTFVPKSCAYLLIHQGKDLPDWHPLVTGDPFSASKAGKSVREIGISQEEIDMDKIEDYVLPEPINK